MAWVRPQAAIQQAHWTQVLLLWWHACLPYPGMDDPAIGR